MDTVEASVERGSNRPSTVTCSVLRVPPLSPLNASINTNDERHGTRHLRLPSHGQARARCTLFLSMTVVTITPTNERYLSGGS